MNSTIMHLAENELLKTILIYERSRVASLLLVQEASRAVCCLYFFAFMSEAASKNCSTTVQGKTHVRKVPVQKPKFGCLNISKNRMIKRHRVNR